MLTWITVAPDDSAISGISAAGLTTPEVPTEIRASQFLTAAIAAFQAPAGRSSPNHTIPGRSFPLHRVHRGRLYPFSFCTNLKLISCDYRRTLAGKTDRIHQAAVQMHDVLRPRALVQVIDILSYDRNLFAGGRQSTNRKMSGVWLGLASLGAPPQIPAPNQLRVLPKSLYRFQSFGVVFLPKAYEFVAKCWNSTCSRDACAGEKHDFSSDGQSYDGSIPFVHLTFSRLQRKRSGSDSCSRLRN
ncbi:hypothetical protein C4J94_5481 [Pseudomonas sp. R5-89-07]|nr:hypothetical protein C4J94_5481 [Pseudomonas sp. R5-89-07]